MKRKRYGAGKSRYEQGKFFPQNKEKYKGSLPIIYRSSWEKAAFLWIDTHPKCISWGSESTVVSYELNGKKHRYFIDITATFQTKDGPKKFFIEIKPHRSTQKPQPSPRKKKETYITEIQTYKRNVAKWEAAKCYAKRVGGTFLILTEKQLFKGK
jgi:hypothetical protein